MHATKHAANSAEQFGGKPEDYIEIHKFLDSSKSHMNDARHRTLTHNSWFIREVVPLKFGYFITNSDGHKVSVVDIAERHVLEDYDMLFVPTLQDFLSSMTIEDWMDNARGGALPPSRAKVGNKVEVHSVPSVTPRPQGWEHRPHAGRAGKGILD